jgi:uncharacterized protein (UPF0548 family)
VGVVPYGAAPRFLRARTSTWKVPPSIGCAPTALPTCSRSVTSLPPALPTVTRRHARSAADRWWRSCTHLPVCPANAARPARLRDDRRMLVEAMSAELAGRLVSAELTYQEVGGTSGALPDGYHHVRRSLVIGAGAEVLAGAVADLFSWRMHLRAGLHVTASAPAAQADGVVVLAIGAGPVRISAPCRVVYVITQPRRHGFAYGTLPGHPESGEEAFVIEQRADGSVAFTITAFSRPATVAARAAGPLGHLIQQHYTRRYLRALADRN